MKPVERNPTFRNPLANATSPYLRQHAHNPVFWYPWGRQAIERARSENKPILLSVGYSTCYWCHVMEREVFENVSIAQLMNQWFINIKVDREELPEIDEIYMTARQMMTGEGGWPNNMFLTPGLKPFWGGGTYPPTDMPGRPAFTRILEWANYAWQTQQEEVRKKADEISQAIRTVLTYRTPEKPEEALAAVPDPAKMLRDYLSEHFDESAGGFTLAPKFPNETYLLFLLGHFRRTQDVRALDMATLSLYRMAAGGIHDHVGGGFHRYAVDKEWYVPHFEKMLYNQSLIARAFTELYEIKKDPFARHTAMAIFDFVSGPLSHKEGGGFYSGIDAETDAVEGAHYAWSAEELQRVLTKEEAIFLQTFYALADIPTFPGHKHVEGQVLVARKPMPAAASERNMPYEQLAALSAQVLHKLLRIRSKRKAPALDHKIIAAWNGLMIDAYARAALAFGIESYTTRAVQAAEFLKTHMLDENGVLMRSWSLGKAEIEGTLEDYAFVIQGLLSLHRASKDAKWLEWARELHAAAGKRFGDKEGGYFYSPEGEYLLARIKSGDDSAIPNANAMMLHNLADLHEITGEPRYREEAEKLASYFRPALRRILPQAAWMVEGMARTETAAQLAPKLKRAKKTKKGDISSPRRGEVRRGAVTARYRPHPDPPPTGEGEAPAFGEGAVQASAALFPAKPEPGSRVEVIITLEIQEGWHINAHTPSLLGMIPTSVEVQGKGVERVLEVVYPQPLNRESPLAMRKIKVYEGLIHITARVKLKELSSGKRPELRALIRFQPCHATGCLAAQDHAIRL